MGVDFVEVYTSSCERDVVFVVLHGDLNVSDGICMLCV